MSYRTLWKVENPMYGLKSWQCANFCSHTLDPQSGSEAHSCLGPDMEWDADEWLFRRTESVWRIPAQEECNFFTPVYQQFNLPFFYHVVLNETLLPPPSYVKLVDHVPPQEQACGAEGCSLLQHILFIYLETLSLTLAYSFSLFFFPFSSTKWKISHIWFSQKLGKIAQLENATPHIQNITLRNTVGEFDMATELMGK